MRIGVILGFGADAPPEQVAAAGRIAEERGLYSLFVPEHVVLFQKYASPYPYSPNGRIPQSGMSGFLEPFVALTWIAAHTRRIRLGTGICILPQRNPVYTAKQVASLDHLSGGRVDLGVGIGWLREEFEVLGGPWKGRAERTLDYLGAMKSLWCDEESSYEGKSYRLPPCILHPKPVQKPHPPVLFGGESEAALRRAATVGDGWFGFHLTAEALRERMARFEGLLEEAGTRRDERRVVVFPAIRKVDPDTTAPFADAGADELVLTYGSDDEDEMRRQADALAKLAS
jgi:probable F420-dependent oxidoreductase